MLNLGFTKNDNQSVTQIINISEISIQIEMNIFLIYLRYTHSGRLRKQQLWFELDWNLGSGPESDQSDS